MSTTVRAQRAQRTVATATLASVAAPPAPAPAPLPSAVTGDAPVATGAPARPVRKPFGERRARLDNTPIPGFQAYWFNDLPGRIDQAKAAGYENVTDANGAPVKKVVGVMEGGGPLTAYRMKIPREWFEQDQADKEAPRKAIDQQMQQGGKDGGYASQGRPGYTESKESANMTADGRQSFGARSQTPG